MVTKLRFALVETVRHH